VNDFLAHLAQAIRIPTVAEDGDPAANHDALLRFHAFLKSTYPKVWESLETEVVNTHSLLLTWPGTDSDADPILLVAHMDVVPIEPGTETQWSVPPFEAATTTSHLIGRGAIDDKGSLIAMFEAVEAAIDAGFTPRRTVMLAIGHDEESMGSAGAAAVVELLAGRGVRAEFVLDEGGFVTEGVAPATKQPIALVGISEKGYLDLEMTASGDTGHSSAPPKATAIGRLADAIAGLQAHPMPAHIELQSDFFESISRAARPGARRLIRNVAKFRGLGVRVLGRQATTNALIRTSMAPTIVHGGVKSNVLPASARAVINFRILPGDTVDSIVTHVRSVVGDDIELRVLQGWEASPVTDIASSGYRAVAEVIGSVFPDALVAPWVVIGATDARYYTRVSDTVLRFLPFRMDADELTGFHGIDERVRLADADSAVRFYRALIERTAG
jgi:carboxypeptidase PM20D1